MHWFAESLGGSDGRDEHPASACWPIPSTTLGFLGRWGKRGSKEIKKPQEIGEGNPCTENLKQWLVAHKSSARVLWGPSTFVFQWNNSWSPWMSPLIFFPLSKIYTLFQFPLFLGNTLFLFLDPIQKTTYVLSSRLLSLLLAVIISQTCPDLDRLYNWVLTRYLQNACPLGSVWCSLG